jgi:hypothetical protein
LNTTELKFRLQVRGDGHQLAQGVYPQLLPLEVQNYHPLAGIGDVPHPWDPNIARYTHTQILKLIIFYNDSFGIDQGDHLGVRKLKLHNWLTGEEREI